MPPESSSPLRVAQPGLAALAEIGRALLDAQLDEDQLCELIYHLAGQIVPTTSFHLGLVEGDRYLNKVWFRDGERQAPAVFAFPRDQGLVSWMKATRQPLLVHDFAAEMDSLPFRPTYQNDRPPRSAIFLPLAVADDLIGIISIDSSQPDAFSEDDLRALSVLANQSASALNNARLYRRGQRRLTDLTAVADVGRKINSILDLGQLLGQVVDLIQARFGYYHVQMYLVPQGSDRAYFNASSAGLNEKWQGRSLRIGQDGIIGWVAQTREPLLVNDVRQEPRYIPDDPRLLPDTRTELAVPLIIEDQVVGVLDVQSTEIAAFGEDDLFVLRTLADQVAVAVFSARAYEAQREEAWVTLVMLQVAEATGQADGIEEVLDAAVRVVAMLAGVESCAIWLRDEDLDCFEYGAGFGLQPIGPPADLPPPSLAMLAQWARDHGLSPDVIDELADQRAIQTAQAPVEQPALHDALRFLSGDWPALDRLREAKSPAVISLDNIFLPRPVQTLFPGDTLALLPMLNKGQVFGVMGVSFTGDSAPNLNERRLAMLSGTAHQVAAAVDNSRLAAAREEEAWVSTVLLQVAEAIGRFQPLDATLAQVAQIAPLLAGVDR
ncbi:MAG TPA: GAF domain-containing protein, partial [Anaerolineae bacterium]